MEVILVHNSMRDGSGGARISFGQPGAGPAGPTVYHGKRFHKAELWRSELPYDCTAYCRRPLYFAEAAFPCSSSAEPGARCKCTVCTMTCTQREGHVSTGVVFRPGWCFAIKNVHDGKCRPCVHLYLRWYRPVQEYDFARAVMSFVVLVQRCVVERRLLHACHAGSTSACGAG